MMLGSKIVRYYVSVPSRCLHSRMKLTWTSHANLDMIEPQKYQIFYIPYAGSVLRDLVQTSNFSPGIAIAVGS